VRGLEAGWEAERRRGHAPPDVELDDAVRAERDRARIAPESAPVDERGDTLARAGDLASSERLVPEVEELPERVRPLDRRLDVDDPVACVRVQPVEARAANDERSLPRLLELLRSGDSDALGHGRWMAVVHDREVRMDVEEDLLAGLAPDPVNGRGKTSGGGRAPCPLRRRPLRSARSPRRPHLDRHATGWDRRCHGTDGCDAAAAGVSGAAAAGVCGAVTGSAALGPPADPRRRFRTNAPAPPATSTSPASLRP
jgi:hypothetical protein